MSLDDWVRELAERVADLEARVAELERCASRVYRWPITPFASLQMPPGQPARGGLDAEMSAEGYVKK